MRFKGLHCHLGSQLFETDQFMLANEVLFTKLSQWQTEFGYVPDVLNLGGGFGIRYTGDDHPLPHREYVEKIVESVKKHVQKANIPFPEIWIEPGRAIAGNAGITLRSEERRVGREHAC